MATPSSSRPGSRTAGIHSKHGQLQPLRKGAWPPRQPLRGAWCRGGREHAAQAPQGPAGDAEAGAVGEEAPALREGVQPRVQHSEIHGVLGADVFGESKGAKAVDASNLPRFCEIMDGMPPPHQEVLSYPVGLTTRWPWHEHHVEVLEKYIGNFREYAMATHLFSRI